MKKNQYIQPKTEIVNVEIQNILQTVSNVYQNNQIKMNSSTMEEGDGGDGASRGSFWDD